ncbi:MAG: thioredoxin family protein [Thiohalomonadales bacterium]
MNNYNHRQDFRVFKFLSYCLFVTLPLLTFISTNSLASEKAKQGKFLGGMDTEYPAWFKESFLDFPEDLVEASKSGKRIIIFFHQDGCPYCNALVDRNISQKHIRKIMQNNFDVIALNMWGDRDVTYFNNKHYTEKTLAEALKIQFTPTLLFYDEKAKVIQRINGYRAPDRFEVELNFAALHKEKETTARNYVKANYKSQTSSKVLHNEDFFGKPPFNLNRTKGGSSRPVAVFFEQKDCPDCDRLHKKVLVDPEARKLISQFDVIQLDMWSKTPLTTPQGKKTTAQDWAKALAISYAPSIVLFNPAGEEIIRSEGTFKLFHTMGIFDYVLSQEYKIQASFQRYLSDRAEKIRETGADVDIWKYANEKAGPK